MIMVQRLPLSHDLPPARSGFAVLQTEPYCRKSIRGGTRLQILTTISAQKLPLPTKTASALSHLRCMPRSVCRHIASPVRGKRCRDTLCVSAPLLSAAVLPSYRLSPTAGRDYTRQHPPAAERCHCTRRIRALYPFNSKRLPSRGCPAVSADLPRGAACTGCDFFERSGGRDAFGIGGGADVGVRPLLFFYERRQHRFE